MFRMLAVFVLLFSPVTKELESSVAFVSSRVNLHKVLLVTVASGRAEYVLSCNEGEASCAPPEPGKNYSLERYSPGIYKCDNVRLMVSNTTEAGKYCLKNVTVK